MSDHTELLGLRAELEQLRADRDRLEDIIARMAEIRHGSPNAMYVLVDHLIKLAAARERKDAQ